MITILFVVAIVFFLATQATILNLGGVNLANESFEGNLLLTKAEGYLENAAIRSLRNSAYTGESLHEGDISCTMQVVNDTAEKDLTSVCQKDQRARKVGMTVSINKGVYTFSKIEERE